MSEKSEKATPEKLKKSRKNGEVGQSQDVYKLVILACGLELVFSLSGWGVQMLMRSYLTPLSIFNGEFILSVKNTLGYTAYVGVLFTLILSAVVIFMRVLGAWIQFGPLFSMGVLKPKIERLDPVKQLKNIFSMRQFTLATIGLVKAAMICLVFYFTTLSILPDLAKTSYGNMYTMIIVVLGILKVLSRTIIVVLIIFSLIDFALQKYFFFKQQRMSIEDIKREYKQNEGDPMMKGYRRAVGQQVLLTEPDTATSVATVEDADVLLVNPTHYAVGLYYDQGITPLPVMLFKAEGQTARNIIKKAGILGKPVIRAVILTRTLYSTIEPGEHIPRETLKAVAEIYKILNELE